MPYFSALRGMEGNLEAMRNIQGLALISLNKTFIKRLIFSLLEISFCLPMAGPDVSEAMINDVLMSIKRLNYQKIEGPTILRTIFI